MRNPSSLLLFTILCCSFANAQENKPSPMQQLVLDPVVQSLISPRHAMPMAQTFPSMTIDTTIDVLEYHCRFDWTMALRTPIALRPLRKTTSNVSITLRSRVNNLRVIILDAVELQIDSVLREGEKLPFSATPTELRITPTTALQRDDQITFTVFFANLSDNEGLYLYSASDAAALNVPYASGFTFSQPENARRIYPCNDQPDDKALFTATLRLPKGFTAVSNGVITDSIADTDSTTIQTWHHPLEMSPYLFAVNASEYVSYSQTHTRTDGSVVPIVNYQFDVDLDGPVFNAKRAVENVPLMFEAFESYFGRYPYETYGHVSVSPVPFGGMEHQTMTTVNRRWLTGQFENGYAHEIAHQWLGDDVTCATWADIWMNEGGATWGEALFEEYRGGADAYRALLWARRAKYMVNGLAEPPVYNIPLAIIFNEATTYCKSAWVYHMMRKLNGDELFFPALRTYIQTYAGSSAQTFQMLEFFKNALPNSPVDWDVFFDQWLVKAGHPVFDVVVRQTSGMQPFAYTVSVAQTQNAPNVPLVFVTPLSFRFTTANGVRDTVVMIDSRTTTFTIEMESALTKTDVDLFNEVLCEKDLRVVSAADDKIRATWCNLLGKHPAVAGQPLGVSVPDAGEGTLVLRSITGETVGSASLVMGVGLVPTADLPAGAYTLSVSSGTRTALFTVLITGE